LDYQLALNDIQGIILKGYRANHAKYVFLHVEKAEAGRRLLEQLSSGITTAVEWKQRDDGEFERPDSTCNLAITYQGLRALEIPARSLNSFPLQLKEGMRSRAELLGDDDASAPENWDVVWQPRGKAVHLLVLIHSWRQEHLDERYDELNGLVSELDSGVRIIGTQDAAALGEDKEHFGFRDNISDPYVMGMSKPRGTRIGKLTPENNWVALAAGEFLLGHSDEGRETLDGPVPGHLARNGSYLVYRKLYQNVPLFRQYIERQGERYPGGKELLAAKMMGRWRDGTPLAVSSKEPVTDSHQNNDFLYGDDPNGTRCPVGSHARRMNPRDHFGFEGKLVNRHRIIRRAMPYGDPCPEDDSGMDSDDRGLIFIAINSNIERQFEFLQREWVNNGNDFKLGDDLDPITGSADENGHMLIPGDAANLKKQPTWLSPDLPRFVETRGGEYFFLPSITALKLIATARVEED
jgi:Dyp-type peroxidase family